MSRSVQIQEVENAIRQLVGMEHARELVQNALSAEGLVRKERYTTDEIRRICERLKERGGMVAVVVSALAVRVIMAQGPNDASDGGAKRSA